MSLEQKKYHPLSIEAVKGNKKLVRLSLQFLEANLSEDCRSRDVINRETLRGPVIPNIGIRDSICSLISDESLLTTRGMGVIHDSKRLSRPNKPERWIPENNCRG
ncbi:MAG: hypothetical protein AMK69_23405 [Nitrospira bacterium SG8_3]|nr:MAG: hypothetical protein AMK69_23405 [Nitrospira bacterium SG8_3]